MLAEAPQCTVIFNTDDGGSAVESAAVEAGGKVVKPTDPTKADNTFYGWFTSTKYSTKYDFNNDVTEDLILYAKFVGDDELLEYTLSDDEQSYMVTSFKNANITDVIIPQSYNQKAVNSIGDSAFYGYSRLTSITIPDGVTSIGDNSFNGCSGLASIYCEASEQPSTWYDGWKRDCAATVTWGYVG